MMKIIDNKTNTRYLHKIKLAELFLETVKANQEAEKIKIKNE